VCEESFLGVDVCYIRGGEVNVVGVDLVVFGRAEDVQGFERVLNICIDRKDEE
jgi:hypothetical protein